MGEERIAPEQVWRHKDVLDYPRLYIVIDQVDNADSPWSNGFVHAHNQETERKTMLRRSTLRRYYDLVPPSPVDEGNPDR